MQLPTIVAAVNESLHAAEVRLPVSRTICTLLHCTGSVDPMLRRFQGVLVTLLVTDTLLLCVAAAALSRCWRQCRRAANPVVPPANPRVRVDLGR